MAGQRNGSPALVGPSCWEASPLFLFNRDLTRSCRRWCRRHRWPWQPIAKTTFQVDFTHIPQTSSHTHHPQCSQAFSHQNLKGAFLKLRGFFLHSPLFDSTLSLKSSWPMHTVENPRGSVFVFPFQKRTALGWSWIRSWSKFKKPKTFLMLCLNA